MVSARCRSRDRGVRLFGRIGVGRAANRESLVVGRPSRRAPVAKCTLMRETTAGSMIPLMLQ